MQPDSSNYIWRFFCRITDPVVAAVALVTPKAAAPVVLWLFGVVWLFWLRVALLFAVPVPRARPESELSRAMERHWYYIGIAFFGTVNGLFNQAGAAVRAHPVKILAPALLFGSVPLTLMFSSLMVSTATVILAGIPAAIYECYRRRQGRLDRSLALDLARRHGHPDPSGHGQFPAVRAVNPPVAGS